MAGDGIYIALESVDILKDAMVDALKHITKIGAVGLHHIGIVYQSVAEMAHIQRSGFKREIIENGIKFFHGISVISAKIIITLRECKSNSIKKLN